MDDDDDAFLRSLNKKRKDASTQRSPDQFEMVMNAFEETAQQKQPFAAVDSPPVLPLEEVELGLEELVDNDNARAFAKEIYAHWKTKRLKANNRSLLTSLKVNSRNHGVAIPLTVIKVRDWRRYR